MSTPSNRRPRLGALVRAVRIQSAADLRPVLLGSGIFSLLLAAGVIITVGRMSNDLVEAYTAYGPMFVAGSVGALSGLITMQIASETFTDRVGGALLRVRILPHGPLVWTISKTVTALVHTMATQLAVLLGAALFVSALQEADELSNAAITRGIDNPATPSCRNYRPLQMRDRLAIALAVAAVVFCFVNARFGDVPCLS